MIAPGGKIKAHRGWRLWRPGASLNSRPFYCSREFSILIGISCAGKMSTKSLGLNCLAEPILWNFACVTRMKRCRSNAKGYSYPAEAMATRGGRLKRLLGFCDRPRLRGLVAAET